MDVAHGEPIPYPLLKRIEDRVVAAALLLLFAPVFAGALALAALGGVLHPGDRGPLIYRERRISHGREFDLLKFRTLRMDALARAAGHAGPLEQEPRNLTLAGRVLKRWYLDELPQLVNVVRGDLSLVGPRPWPVRMVEEQVAAGQDYRLRVPAGWTGPAQVTKGALDPVSYAELDVTYVEALRSRTGAELIRYDVAILLETARVILRGEGLRF